MLISLINIVNKELKRKPRRVDLTKEKGNNETLLKKTRNKSIGFLI